MASTPTLGVSVVLCCHNSADRLQPTLAHLARQEVGDVCWEVILVDNGSTDGTSRIARDLWPSSASAPLRVVAESRPGLASARARGFAEARYEIVSFVDDDNWLAIDWVRHVAEIMTAHADVGACGGLNEAACEIDPPSWFALRSNNYAVGPQGTQAGDVTWERGWLWGAGLSVRRSAWEQLRADGFQGTLVDRSGNQLSSGGDVELCFALRAAGWRLWYDPRLRLQHFIPAERLSWKYLRRLNRAFGAAYPIFRPYWMQTPTGQKPYPTPSWTREARWSLRRLFNLRGKLFKAALLPLDGDLDVLEIEENCGLLSSLLRLRGRYALHHQQVEAAPWNRLGKPA